MDEERTAKCESCGFTGTLDDFDVCGSCPGSLLCNECGTEFVAQTGEPSLLCGVCTGCKWLKEDDEWESVQADRHEDLGKSNTGACTVTINIKITSNETIEHDGKQYRPVAIRCPKKGERYISAINIAVAGNDFMENVYVILEEVLPPYRTPTDEDARKRPMAEFWDGPSVDATMPGVLVAVKREGAGRRFVAMDVATCGLSTWIHCRIPNEGATE